MTITLHEVRGDELEQIIPLLLQAEPSERALRWGLAHLSDAVYRAERDGRTVGAATMQWRDDPCEIEELAVAPELQGQGVGRQIIELLVAEARKRGKQTMLVGTANSSIGNLAFYQKAGFRMDHIRQNYFRYHREPLYENGLQVLDMVMFRREL